jgi:hypothetical protein
VAAGTCGLCWQLDAVLARPGLNQQQRQYRPEYVML